MVNNSAIENMINDHDLLKRMIDDQTSESEDKDLEEFQETVNYLPRSKEANDYFLEEIKYLKEFNESTSYSSKFLLENTDNVINQISTSRGFEMQEDGIARNDTYVEYTEQMSNVLSNFTVCFRIFPFYFRRFMPILSYATSSNPFEFLIGK